MKNIVLITILLLTFFLSTYGINWGLPSRWGIDEPVAGALRMIAEKKIIPKNDFYHPTLHYFLLIAFLLPLLVFLKITGYPLEAVREAASVSWINLSIVDPRFSALVYVAARLSSVVFAVLSVYIAYRLAEKIFSRRAGIFTGLFLSVTMGFIQEAHMAKSTMLLVFLVMLAVYTSLHYFEKETLKKYTVPFFIAGLALATKYSAGILVFPLGYYLVNLIKRDGIKGAFFSIIAFPAGFLLGFPGLLLNLSSYIETAGHYPSLYMPKSTSSMVPTFISGIGGYSLVLKDAFGLLLFLLVVFGIIFSIWKKKFNFPLKMILLTVVPYVLFFSVNPKAFELKYISLIIPFLVILASGVTEGVFMRKGIKRNTALAVLSFVWILSLLYTLACGSIYANGDIRYKATDWIEKNLDRSEKIIVIGHPEWVIHNRLFKDFDIFLVNNDPRSFNPSYNRQFTSGRQLPLSKTQVDKIQDELKKRHDYFVIYPVFVRRDRIHIREKKENKNNYGFDMESQKVVKEFSREWSSFYGRPNLGGYEPEKIVIAHGIK